MESQNNNLSISQSSNTGSPEYLYEKKHDESSQSLSGRTLSTPGNLDHLQSNFFSPPISTNLLQTHQSSIFTSDLSAISTSTISPPLEASIYAEQSSKQIFPAEQGPITTPAGNVFASPMPLSPSHDIPNFVFTNSSTDSTYVTYKSHSRALTKLSAPSTDEIAMHLDVGTCKVTPLPRGLTRCDTTLETNPLATLIVGSESTLSNVALTNSSAPTTDEAAMHTDVINPDDVPHAASHPSATQATSSQRTASSSTSSSTNDIHLATRVRVKNSKSRLDDLIKDFSSQHDMTSRSVNVAAATTAPTSSATTGMISSATTEQIADASRPQLRGGKIQDITRTSELRSGRMADASGHQNSVTSLAGQESNNPGAVTTLFDNYEDTETFAYRSDNDEDFRPHYVPTLSTIPSFHEGENDSDYQPAFHKRRTESPEYRLGLTNSTSNTSPPLETSTAYLPSLSSTTPSNGPAPINISSIVNSSENLGKLALYLEQQRIEVEQSYDAFLENDRKERLDEWMKEKQLLTQQINEKDHIISTLQQENTTLLTNNSNLTTRNANLQTAFMDIESQHQLLQRDLTDSKQQLDSYRNLIDAINVREAETTAAYKTLLSESSRLSQEHESEFNEMACY